MEPKIHVNIKGEGFILSNMYYWNWIHTVKENKKKGETEKTYDFYVANTVYKTASCVVDTKFPESAVNY